MNQPASKHPDGQQLADYGLGRLEPTESGEIERHVASCDSCCETLAKLTSDTLLELVRATGATTTDGHRKVIWSPEDLEIPPQLVDHPRYEILRLCGFGGMGAVFEAKHRLMNRTVALKVINRSLIANDQALQRFQLEVMAAARLSHPNIVTAYDAEQAGDLHFLVMEFVDGVNLARHIERFGRMAPREACELVRQAALGLQHAHEQGMVHRDI